MLHGVKSARSAAGKSIAHAGGHEQAKGMGPHQPIHGMQYQYGFVTTECHQKILM